MDKKLKEEIKKAQPILNDYDDFMKCNKEKIDDLNISSKYALLNVIIDDVLETNAAKIEFAKAFNRIMLMDIIME